MRKYLYLLVIAFPIQGCVETTNEERYDSFNLKQKVQEYDYFVNSDTVLVGDGGTKICLKKGSLNIKTGKVKVQLSEFYSISDMILAGLSTVSNDNLLETAGMICLNIKTEDGEKVYLEDTKCTFQTPKQAIIKEDMLLFNGAINDQDIINWRLNIVAAVPTDSVLINKNYIDQSYFFQLSSLGWINCDRFIEVEEQLDLIVDVTNDGGSYSLVMKSFNSIIPGFVNENNQLVFKGIPANEPISLVGIAKKGEKIYYSLIDANSSDDDLVFQEYEEIGINELREKLEVKFGTVL